MTRLMYSLATILLVLSLPRPAAAEPVWGANCLSCHGLLQTDMIHIVGQDTLADPDESATGAPDRGTLPVFQAYRGGSKPLYAELTSLLPDDTYAVQLKRLRFPGVETGGQLRCTGDCAWSEWGDNANYFTDPYISYRWGTGPASFTFAIDVEPNTTPDYYDLVFAVAGKSSIDGSLFYAEEHFYLQVSPLSGDLNCDGSLNNFDISPFVLALTNPVAYAVAYPDCDIHDADINGDGHVNSFDITPFVQLLVGN